MVRRNETMRSSRSSSRTMMEARMRGSILPPHRISPTLRPRNRSGSASMAASPAAPAPFRHRLLQREEGVDRALDQRLVDQHDVAHAVRARPAASACRHSSPRCLRPASRRRTAGCPGGSHSTSTDRARHSTPTISIDGFFARAAMAQPATSPPPPIGTTSTSSSGPSSSISSAIVPCPAMMCGSSYGWTHTRFCVRRDRLGARLRFRHRLAVENDGGAERLGRLDFHERRRHRHDDGRRDGETAGVIGDRLGVIAGRHRDDAAAALVGGERGKLDAGAALLERVRDLQILVFDEDLGAGQRRQRRRRQQRRAQHVAADRAAGRLDIGERHHRRLILISAGADPDGRRRLIWSLMCRHSRAI